MDWKNSSAPVELISASSCAHSKTPRGETQEQRTNSPKTGNGFAGFKVLSVASGVCIRVQNKTREQRCVVSACPPRHKTHRDQDCCAKRKASCCQWTLDAHVECSAKS